MSEFKLQLDDFSPEDSKQIMEIFRALIETGGMLRVKGGKTILHFDAAGVFAGIELDYWPWRRRK